MVLAEVVAVAVVGVGRRKGSGGVMHGWSFVRMMNVCACVYEWSCMGVCMVSCIHECVRCKGGGIQVWC